MLTSRTGCLQSKGRHPVLVFDNENDDRGGKARDEDDNNKDNVHCHCSYYLILGSLLTMMAARDDTSMKLGGGDRSSLEAAADKQAQRQHMRLQEMWCLVEEAQ